MRTFGEKYWIAVVINFFKCQSIIIMIVNKLTQGGRYSSMLDVQLVALSSANFILGNTAPP